MANKEHLKILKQGVEVWNEWREENLEIKPDLSGADLSGADLSGADLNDANLRKANLLWADLGAADLADANLSDANLIDANLTVADFSDANLSKADLGTADLSGAILIEADLTGANLRDANLSEADLTRTNLTGADLSEANLNGANITAADFTLTTPNLSGARLHNLSLNGPFEEGVNGFYCDETKSTALMSLDPPGNSMQGSNPDAVLESLKRARRLHGQSMAFAGIMLLIAVLGLKQIKFTSVDLGQDLTPDKFGLLAMSISIGLLSLVVSFMVDALKGARYLQDRNSAMTIGNFPWVLSKFAGKGWSKIQSLLTRAIVSFHPLAYIYYLFRWEDFAINITIFYVALMVPLLGFSAWILLFPNVFKNQFFSTIEQKQIVGMTL